MKSIILILNNIVISILPTGNIGGIISNSQSVLARPYKSTSVSFKFQPTVTICLMAVVEFKKYSKDINCLTSEHLWLNLFVFFFISVSKCMQALKYVLPRDVYTQIFIKWYSVRNAPGPSDMDTKLELNAFLISLLCMIGFDADKVVLGDCTKNISAPHTQVKKQKTHEKGSDDVRV